MHERPTLARRTMLLGLGAAAAAPTLAGCVGAGGQPTNTAPSIDTDAPIEGTVQFWTINLRKNFQEYFETLIADFEAQHSGVTIDWVDVPGADMTSKFLSAIASGKAPDVVNVDSKNLGQLNATLTDLDSLYPGDDLAAFQPGLVEGLRVGGKLKGIPWYNGGTRLVVYRKSTMDKIGFDLDQAPKDWYETLDLATKVHEETGVYGMNAYPGNRQLKSLGVKFVNDDLTEAIFNTDEAAEIVTKFQDAYRSGAIAPGASAPDAKEPQTVDNGQIAFNPDAGPGSVTSLQKKAPKAYEDLMVSLGPQTLDGKNQMTGQMCFSIPAKSQNKAGGKAFLDFVASPEAQLEFCKLVAIFPSTVETLEAPLFSDAKGANPTDRARSIVVEAFPDAVDTTIPLPAGIPNQMRTDFNLAMKEVMRTGDDAKAALAAQHKIWQAALDKANGR